MNESSLKMKLGDKPGDVIVEIPKQRLPSKPRIEVECAADVIPQPIRWLWPGKFAKGKLSIIAGDPGLGKSMLTTAFASHISTGSNWPVDHSPCTQGSTIMLSAEDDLADTIRPRLDAAGADPTNVFVLKMVDDVNLQTGEPSKRSFSLARDIQLLEDVLHNIPNCQLITIDPISSYLGGTDSHNNADIRGLLAPLSELAQKHNVAVIGVTHLNKGSGAAMYRAMGSLAFVAAARSAYCVTKDKDDPNRRLVLPIKNNLGLDSDGVSYRIAVGVNGAPFIQWEDEAVTISADEALSPDSNEKEAPAKDDAREFLEIELAVESMPVKELKKLALDAGHSWRTIERAKKELNIKATKIGVREGWEWRLLSNANQGFSEVRQDTPHPNNAAVLGVDGGVQTNKGFQGDYDGGNLGEYSQHRQDRQLPECGDLRKNSIISDDEGEL